MTDNNPEYISTNVESNETTGPDNIYDSMYEDTHVTLALDKEHNNTYENI